MAKKKNSTEPSIHPAAVETPPSGPTPQKGGRLGLILVLLSIASVSAWTFARVSTTVAEKQEIASKRKQAPVSLEEVFEVNVVRPERAEWLPVVPFEGTIDANQRSELGFKVGGKLARVFVRLGDRVKTGQLLGQLDAQEAAAQKQAAAAQLDAARAQLALTRDQEDRTGKLVQSGALASAQGVQAEQARALAEAQAAAASANLGLAQTALANHTLVAPFSGIVTRAPSTQGSVVAPGQALFEIVDNSRLLLRGTINEADVGYFAPGAPVLIDGKKVGSVRVVVGVLDRVTRRVPVEAELDPSEDLRVGSFVRATIAGTDKISVFRLPGTALRPGSQGTVMVVEGDRLREVEVHFSVEPETGELLVRSGLRGDEQIVKAPRPEAATGDRVKVVEAGPAAATDSAKEPAALRADASPSVPLPAPTVEGKN